MNSDPTIILNSLQIRAKLRRIAYQILESNFSENEIVIAGIEGGGSVMARLLTDILVKITDKKIIYLTISLNKKNPLSGIKTDIEMVRLKNKSVVIVDDVLNSGRTLIYAVRYFLEIPLKKIKTAVLINRNHKEFPVKADFKGLSLSTSLKENIVVTFDGEKSRVELV